MFGSMSNPSTCRLASQTKCHVAITRNADSDISTEELLDCDRLLLSISVRLGIDVEMDALICHTSQWPPSYSGK